MHLEKHNIPGPKSIIVKKGDIPNNVKLNYPLVVKPVEGYGGGIGVKTLNNYNEVQTYYEKQSFDCDTIIQNYIRGYDLSVNVLCEKGELICYSMQKGTDFLNGELSPQIGFNFVDIPELLDQIKFLFEHIKLVWDSKYRLPL